ncbi:MAG: inorganic phosphate transporter [Candidatus Dormibacteraeota bacterium]|nr:inorganic phosphate transporter [Candidatus Dormibacteraeota bacterium]
MTDLLLLLTIAVALGFDFTNGFHDTANAVATTIGTRALRPPLAIVFSARLNLVGALVATQLLHTKVANTIGSLVGVKTVALPFIMAALVGAIAWNLITWRAGLPSSSSHALIGGLLGMGVAGYGLGAIKSKTLITTITALVTSPIAGLVLAYLVMVLLSNVLRSSRPAPANRVFRRLQILSSGFVSFSHGANDSQKTMAIIALALVSTHHLKKFAIPTWVAVIAALAIGLGTYAGGWRIIRTMGTRIIKLQPINGFTAETVAAVVIQVATQFSQPVSTTHVVSGAVMGSGATARLSAVRWGVARNILFAWVLTIPAAALVAGALTLGLKAAGVR